MDPEFEGFAQNIEQLGALTGEDTGTWEGYINAHRARRGLLAAAGLDVQDDQLVPQGRPHSDPLSLEALSRVDGDWLFVATLDANGAEALDQAMQSDAFKRLAVVGNDRVVAVDGQLWTSASGPIAAQAVLDDIEQALEGVVTP